MKALIIFLFFSVLIYGADTDNKIDFKKDILQVGAFSTTKTLKKLQTKLSNYNLLTKKIDNYIKLFVLNPTKKDIEVIKKTVPSAFLLSTTAKEKLFSKNTRKKDEIPVVKINLQTINQGLNTQTIVKTRKKFFK